MGFLSGIFGNSDLPRVEAPSEAFADPVEAIAHLLSAQRDLDESWATFEAETSAGTAWTLQVADDSLNLLRTRVELGPVLERLGLSALASVARKGGRRGDDPTLWHLPDASCEEIAAVVDGLFAEHFGVGMGYRLRGWVER